MEQQEFESMKRPDLEAAAQENGQETNTSLQEAIGLVQNTTNLEELAQLAFDNKLVGSKYFPLRYQHLLDTMGESLTDHYSDIDYTDGYMLDKTGKKTDVHITQLDHPATDADFYPATKSHTIDYLSMPTEDDLEAAA